jgi:hypothetical protein
LLQTIEKPLQIALYLKFYDQIGDKVSPAVSVPDVTELEIRDQAGKRLYFYTHSKEHIESRHKAVHVTHTIKEPTTGQSMGSMALYYSDLAYEETRKSIHKIVYGVWASIALIFFCCGMVGQLSTFPSYQHS